MKMIGCLPSPPATALAKRTSDASMLPRAFETQAKYRVLKIWHSVAAEPLVIVESLAPRKTIHSRHSSTASVSDTPNGRGSGASSSTKFHLAPAPGQGQVGGCEDSPEVLGRYGGRMTLTEWLNMHLDVNRADFEEGSIDAAQMTSASLAAVVAAVEFCDLRLSRLEQAAGLPFRMEED
jgi:hypothetical protein